MKSAVKTGNTKLTGAGANTLQDRGAIQTSAQFSLNPYFNNNFYARWQELTRWYYTSWEAGKVVDIPVQDAFRIPIEIKGIEARYIKAIEKEIERFGVHEKFKRAATQERLLGGSLIVIGTKEVDGVKVSDELDFNTIGKGDLQFVNVTSVNLISKAEWYEDPLSKDYNKPKMYYINGTPVSTSRLIAFDGDPLFDYASQRLLQNFRVNPQGFGESVLYRLFDSIKRAVGTQEAGYQLIQMASVMLIECESLLELQASKPGEEAINKLHQIAEQISIYKAAILDAQGAKVGQYAANFGSVPELIMTYLQILSAGSDIPATRFLGSAPGGLNATGESDSENYYNSIDSYQKDKLRPKYLKIIDVIARSIMGSELWNTMKGSLTIEFPPLWNLDEKEKAEVEYKGVDMLRMLAEAEVISRETFVEELSSRKILNTSLEDKELPERIDLDYNNMNDGGQETGGL